MIKFFKKKKKEDLPPLSSEEKRMNDLKAYMRSHPAVYDSVVEYMNTSLDPELPSRPDSVYQILAYREGIRSVIMELEKARKWEV